MDKILVTGGCGYIGSHTIIELLETTPYEVISCDNYVNSSAETLTRIEKITNRRVKNYAVDLCQESAVLQIFEENPDLVGAIHFAALKSVPESVANPLFYYQNNLNSQINLMRACEQFGVLNFIFSSSCSAYGNVEELPVRETTPFRRAESPYAYTKQIGERFLEDFSKNSAMKMIALRYFNPVGAHPSGLIGETPVGKPNNLTPMITQTAIGKMPKMVVLGGDYPTRDGTCVRDYVHVSDIAQAHINAINYLKAQKNKSNFEVFNLGTGRGVTVLEAIHAFEKMSGVRLNYEIGKRREGDVEAIYSDNTRAETVLGWTPRYSIDDMMLSAWKWEQEMQQTTPAR